MYNIPSIGKRCVFTHIYKYIYKNTHLLENANQTPPHKTYKNLVIKISLIGRTR